MIDFHELQNNQMEAGTSPVQDIPLMMTGDDVEVFIELILDNDGGGGGGGGGVDDNQFIEVTGVGRRIMERRSNMMGTHELHYINSLLIHLREKNKAIRDEMARYHEKEKRMWKMMNKNLKSLMRRLAMMYGIHEPAQRHEGGDGSDRNRWENDYSKNSQICQDDENLPTLTHNPTIIHEFWDKYEFGIRDRKAVKNFTSKERRL